MNGVPFFAPAGTILHHVELGRLRFLEHLGAFVLHIVLDEQPDQGPVRIRMPGSDGLIMTTLPWLLGEYAAGRVWDVGVADDVQARSARFLGLDRAACIELDPKSAYRHDWALAAIQAGLPRTAKVIDAWSATAEVPGHPDDPEVLLRLKRKRPDGRAVIRWMGKLMNGDMAIGAMVNTSGRLRGETQLPNVVDRLVHRVAMTFIADRRLSSIDDAAAYGTRLWRQLAAAGVDGIGDAPPTPETYRLRVRLLDGRVAEDMRHGSYAAKKRFQASGEPVPTERGFERVTIDGTEFEHACAFAEDWKIPSNKMKMVASMDSHDQFVFPPVIFSGPYRAEMGIQATLNVMVPPDLTPADIEADLYAGMLTGLPSDLIYDNDKTMLPPSIVPAGVTLTSSIELLPIYLSDAKAKHENFHRFVKAKLRGLSGRVLGPTRMADPRYDPIRSADVVRAVYAQMVRDAVREWNDLPRLEFGNKSPRQLKIEQTLAGGNRLVDPGRIRRHFAGTPSERQVLTKDGLVYDNIRYRWNRKGISEILDNNHRDTPFAKRLIGTARLEVSIRVYDGDIDMIEVLDDDTGDYHRMWSTNPRYTGGLSRWEHHQYGAMIRAGRGGAISDAERVAHKAKRLVAFDQEMPEADFRARENMAALIEKEDIRRKSGVRGADPLFGQLPEIGLVTEIGGAGRADTPKPPPQPIVRKDRRPPEAPARPADYGYASVTQDGADPPVDAIGADRTVGDGETAKPRELWADDRPDDEDETDDGAGSDGASNEGDDG